jgi:hypothetical protein
VRQQRPKLAVGRIQLLALADPIEQLLGIPRPEHLEHFVVELVVVHAVLELLQQLQLVLRRRWWGRFELFEQLELVVVRRRWRRRVQQLQLVVVLPRIDPEGAPPRGL